MKRREFLKIFIGGILIVFSVNRFKFKRTNSFIRPPGSLSEEEFIFKCLRCGECIKICPAKCLKPVPIKEGIYEWGTPHIIPREKACLLCLSCGKVCPSGAIQKINYNEIKIGTGEINVERCLVWQENKDCLVCMEVCPVGAIEIDEKRRPHVKRNICVGCGQCEMNCPVDGEAAIKVKNIGEKRKKLRKKGG